MARTFTNKDFNAEGLLQSGLDHIDSAEYLLHSSDPRKFDSAGYLAHIGIELMIKAWLLYENKKFPGIHPLRDLLEDLEESVSGLHFSQTERQTIDYLSNFIELRYPNRSKPVEIGQEDIEQIYELANALWQQMPDHLIEKYTSLPIHKKGGRVFMERPINIPRDLELETGFRKEK